MSFFVKVLKNGSVRSITNASSLTIMQAALPSVNWALKPKPSLRKKSIERCRSRTARLTKSLRDGVCAMAASETVSDPIDCPGRHESSVPSRELERQSEEREKRGGIQERRPAGDLLAGDLEHDERPRPQTGSVRAGMILREGRRAAGSGGDEPRPAA